MSIHAIHVSLMLGLSILKTQHLAHTYNVIASDRLKVYVVRYEIP